MALQDKLSLLDTKRQAVLDCEADIAAKKTEFEAALGIYIPIRFKNNQRRHYFKGSIGRFGKRN